MTRYFIHFLLAMTAVLAGTHEVLAAPDLQIGVTNIAENTIESISRVPGIITALSYLFALMFGVSAILKLKEHVENPGQNPLRTPAIRFAIGGALISLPIVYEAMAVTIGGSDPLGFDPDNGFNVGGFISGVMGSFSGLLGDIGLTQDFNAVLSNIIESIEGLPGFITAIAYLLGLVLGVQGLLHLKEHAENPDQKPLKEALVRLIAGGAFFAIPTIYNAMFETITGGDDGGIMGIISSGIGAINLFSSTYDEGSCTGEAIDGVLSSVTFGFYGSDSKTTLGTSLCGIITHAGAFPAFLTSISYLFGLVFGFWGLLKLRDHGLDPSRTTLWDGINRMMAGGAFLALPVIVETIRATVTPASSVGSSIIGTVGSLFGSSNTSNTGYSVTGIDCGSRGVIDSLIDSLFSSGSSSSSTAVNTLDTRLYCAVTDVLMPMHAVINLLAMCAGMVLIMIGISRLLKGMQDGPRAPGGIGTIMTFISGGVLISFNDFIRLFTSSLFGGGKTATLVEEVGQLGGAELVHAQIVISSILKFLIIVGLVSFLRGIFIVRKVAEGDGQSSLMAGLTHMIGGAVAINLGPFLNLVQTTLGIETGFGIFFS